MKYLIHRKIKGFLVLSKFHKAPNKVVCIVLVRGNMWDEIRGYGVPCLVKSDLWVCPPLMWSDIQHHFPQMMVTEYCHMYVHIVLRVAGFLLSGQLLAKLPGLARSGRNLLMQPSVPDDGKYRKSNTSCQCNFS